MNDRVLHPGCQSPLNMDGRDVSSCWQVRSVQHGRCSCLMSTPDSQARQSSPRRCDWLSSKKKRKKSHWNFWITGSQNCRFIQALVLIPMNVQRITLGLVYVQQTLATGLDIDTHMMAWYIQWLNRWLMWRWAKCKQAKAISKIRTVSSYCQIAYWESVPADFCQNIICSTQTKAKSALCQKKKKTPTMQSAIT